MSEATGVLGFAVIDGDGRIARVDRHVEIVTRMPAAELVGRRLSELVPGAAAGRSIEYELAGSRVDVALSLDGTMASFRETGETELRRARDRLGFALAASGMGVWEWDPAANRVYWSAHLAELAGIEMPGPDAKLGDHAYLIHPDDRSNLLGAARRVADEGSLLEPLDARVRRPDGTWRPMHVFAHRTVDRRVVAVFVDITARHDLELALRNAQKLEALGQVAASVAHDFNNLLQVILLGASALRASSLTGELEEIAAEVEGAGDRALALARQLLTFSRTAKFEPSVVDLGGTVKSLEPILQRLVKGKARLAFEISPDTPAVWADRTQIEQVVLNLVVNARDALQHAGAITVSTSRASDAGGTSAVLAVHDDGPGVPAELHARIFEPFFTTKPGERGTGLGLAMVQKVAQQWRGRVTLDSPPGQGAQFQLHLPAHVAQSPSS